MIELRVRPQHRIVALLACGRERRGYVIDWRQRGVEVLLVTRNACCVGDRVVVVDMAVGALPGRHRVRSRQRKSGSRVIERRRLPRRRVMAGLAGLRESLLRVIRIGRVLIILQVARDTRVRGQVVVVVGVAIRTLARRNRVHPCQREIDAIVIEACRRPPRGGVALSAVLREIRGYVVRVRRALKILQVATHTRRRRQVVIVVDVAIRALPRRNRVHSRQRESRTAVVEMRIKPAVAAMACLAGY